MFLSFKYSVPSLIYIYIYIYKKREKILATPSLSSKYETGREDPLKLTWTMMIYWWLHFSHETARCLENTPSSKGYRFDPLGYNFLACSEEKSSIIFLQSTSYFVKIYLIYFHGSSLESHPAGGVRSSVSNLLAFCQINFLYINIYSIRSRVSFVN
jgi:hypothetical protein